MGGPQYYHNKWCKSDRERRISHDSTYMWNLFLKGLPYLQSKNRFTDIENKFTITKVEMEGEG